MTLNQLVYFTVAAKELHFGRAAKELCISQPSLSIALAHLEDELGLALFEKSGRGVALTDAGRALQSRAARILEQVDDARREMDEIRTHRERSVNLAYVSTLVAGGYIPGFLDAFLQSYSDQVDLRTDEVPTVDAVRGVKEGKYDLALCMRADGDPELEQVKIYGVPYALMAPPDSPLTEACTLADAARYPFILYRTGPVRRFIETLLRRAGVAANVAHYTYSDMGIIHLVRRGLGVAIVNDLPGMEHEGVRLLRTPWLEGYTHDIYLTRRAGEEGGAAVRRLWDYILAHAPGKSEF